MAQLTTTFEGLDLRGRRGDVEHDFARALETWLQAGPWTVGAAGRAIGLDEGAAALKALLAFTPIAFLGALLPGEKATEAEVARGLAPLAPLADVIALRDDGSHEALVAFFADDLDTDALREMRDLIMLSAARLPGITRPEGDVLFTVIVLVVTFASGLGVVRAVELRDESELLEPPLLLQMHFVDVSTARVDCPWNTGGHVLTYDGDALHDTLLYMKHFRRERRRAERRAAASRE